MVDTKEEYVYGGAAGIAEGGDFKGAFLKCLKSVHYLMDREGWTPVRVVDIRVVRKATTEVHMDVEFKEGRTEQPFKDWFFAQ